MKNLALIFVLTFLVSVSFAQERKSKKQVKAELKSQKIQLIKNLVDNKTFVFKAYSVVPKNEKIKTLISDFGIEVRNDSIFSYLPYYGNTYSRDYTNFKDSPMGFAQQIISYKRVKTKSGYEVNIKVKNLNELIELVFHISKMGDATVVASSLNRQAITYLGEIYAPKSGE